MKYTVNTSVQQESETNLNAADVSINANFSNSKLKAESSTNVSRHFHPCTSEGVLLNTEKRRSLNYSSTNLTFNSFEKESKRAVRCHSDLGVSQGPQKISAARVRYLSSIKQNSSSETMNKNMKLDINGSNRATNSFQILASKFQASRESYVRNAHRGSGVRKPTMKHPAHNDSSNTVSTEYSSSVSLSDDETEFVDECDSFYINTPTGESTIGNENHFDYIDELQPTNFSGKKLHEFEVTENISEHHGPQSAESKATVVHSTGERTDEAQSALKSFETSIISDAPISGAQENEFTIGLKDDINEDVDKDSTLLSSLNCAGPVLFNNEASFAPSLNSLKQRLERAKRDLAMESELKVDTVQIDHIDPFPTDSTLALSRCKNRFLNIRKSLSESSQLLFDGATEPSSTDIHLQRRSSLEIWAGKFEQRKASGNRTHRNSFSKNLTEDNRMPVVHPIRSFYSAMDSGMPLHLYPSLTRQDLQEMYEETSIVI